MENIKPFDLLTKEEKKRCEERLSTYPEDHNQAPKIKQLIERIKNDL